MWLMATVLIGLLLSFSASAETIAPPCGTVPIQQLNYVKKAEIEKFDPSLGELKSVTITVDAFGYAWRTLKNQDPIPIGVDYFASLTATMVSDIPSIGEHTLQIGDTFNFHLAPGESYDMLIGSHEIPKNAHGEFIIDDPIKLSAYIGKGEKAQIAVVTNSGIQVSGSTEWSSNGETYMGVTVCVIYEYVPPCISGKKINDHTGQGIEGWTIDLLKDGVVIATTQTNSDGYYEFCGLLPGDYEVCEEDRDGWKHIDDPCRDITLSGVDVENVDFRNMPLLCISGHKFNSKTGEGISGWTIQLEDSAGAVIATTTTVTGGYYEFCGLVPGNYVVREESRDGWKHVDPEVPYIAVTLDDKNVEDIDFRNVPLFSISGHKFHYNTQEGLSGWTISLLKDGVTIATTTTGPGGYYEFLKLEPGDYVVCEEDRDGWQHMDEPCRDVTLELENVADVDFSNAPLLCISGHKFNSKTGEGISGWTIQLEDSAGAVIATTTTVTGGYYEFCGLVPGNYVVSEESRDGWKHVDPEVPHIAVTLDDENAEDIDFHNVPLFSISGHKFNYNTQEGLSGWSIRLLKDGVTIATTTTGLGGYYEFLKLEPGDYEVCEEDRDGWQHMDEPCRDVTLELENVADVDFNNAPLLCISGHKFNSKTGDGLSGWTIQLKDSTGAVIDTTTTGTGGYYEFCGLEAGDYEVCEVLKPGWKAVGSICIDVTLVSQDSTDNDFENEPIIPPCVCPFLIKNDLYTASCNEVKVVDADNGILANDPAGSVVLNPESITIDPKYGTIEVNEDGSFVYDPTVATGHISSGSYVIFKYNANNGYCDSKNPGIAKIQVSCPRR
ncbi:SdrD B-like domain-containing protein [Methanothrix sp.]|uniref:SdrD B-like domain-containing protein n=1 Tax=Methanothrix sp. TaxID=90426 RepID=UPI003C713D80